MDPTDGPHLAASVRGGERGGKGKAGLGREKVTGRFLGCGKRKRKKEETGRDGPIGLKRDRGKRKVLHFLEKNQCIQFKFEFKNSNSNWTTNNKTMQKQHECNTKRTTLFNLENNQHIFYFTLNSL